MNCPEEGFIGRYIGHGVSEAEEKEFEAHQQVCASCAERVLEARKNETLLAEIKSFKEISSPPSPTPEPPGLKPVKTVEQAQTLLGNRYRVVKKVGEGSAGTVFQAIDTILDRAVGIKFLRVETGLTGGTDRWNEARIMGQLNHPNIAQVYEIGEKEGKRFFVMEWVDGLPLTEAWTTLGLPQRLEIFLGVAGAVAEAHRRGVIHRDLKPSNILVTAGSHPKVLDFGIALESRSVEDIERGLYRGTPAYSSPEQITSPKQISPATDVFALGILMYQLLTDNLPFPQTDPKELFEAIRNEYPELPKTIEKNVPIPLQNICLKAMEKVPHKRYSSAKTLADDIERYLEGEPVWARPSYLIDKIQQEVFYHRQKIIGWYNNELITQREFDRLENVYEHIIAPPDPSLFETRKLSFSQVSLYFGGWVALLGIFALFYEPLAKSYGPWMAVPAITASAFIILWGMFLWNKGESSWAVGCMAMADVFFPAALLVSLWHWGILSPQHPPVGKEQISVLLFEWQSAVVVGNAQLWVSSFFWLLCSLLFLYTTRSSVFVFFSVLSGLAFLSCFYLFAGLLEWPWEWILISYLVPALGMFALGAVLDRKRYPHIAWPLSLMGLIVIISLLTALTMSIGKAWSPIRPGRRWISSPWFLFPLAANGAVYLALAMFCRKVNQRLHRRIGYLLDRLGLFLVLGSLSVLAVCEGGSDPRYLYLLLLVAVSFIFASVALQTKSFFFFGIAGLTIAIHKFTEYFGTSFRWPTLLMFVGFFWMFLSYLAPRLKRKNLLKQ
jgi:serine/threonine protein kinase